MSPVHILHVAEIEISAAVLFACGLWINHQPHKGIFGRTLGVLGCLFAGVLASVMVVAPL